MPIEFAVSATCSRPDVEVELGEDGVVGGDRRLLQVDPAEVALVGGVHLPVAPLGQVEVERFRGVVGRVGVDALLDRRGQDEGLEGRAGLAVALGGEVELALRRSWSWRPSPRSRRCRDRSRPAPRRGRRVGQGRAHRFQADLLQPRLERRVDLEAAVAHGVGPVALDQLVFDVVEEVGLAVGEVGAGDVEAEAALLRPAAPARARCSRGGPSWPARRCGAASASCGWRIGLYSEGACGRPASSAACSRRQLPDRLGEVDLRGGPDADRGRAFDRPVGGGVEVLVEDLAAASGARRTRSPASPR